VKVVRVVGLEDDTVVATSASAAERAVGMSTSPGVP